MKEMAMATKRRASTTAEPVTDKTADELVAEVDKRTEARSVPDVLSGRVVTEHVDPDAERALKDPKVAETYQAAKAGLHEYVGADSRRTDALKALAKSLVDLRGHFKQPGSRGKRVDWNGQSAEYRALAALLYADAGLEADQRANTQRAVRHHVEDVKRELVPKKQWEHYGIEALTRGQRQALSAKFGRETDTLEAAATDTASKAATGQATGQQLVSLAKRIDAGISVYSMASLRSMTAAQRRVFRDQLADTREKADAILRELDEID